MINFLYCINSSN